MLCTRVGLSREFFSQNLAVKPVALPWLERTREVACGGLAKSRDAELYSLCCDAQLTSASTMAMLMQSAVVTRQFGRTGQVSGQRAFSYS